MARIHKFRAPIRWTPAETVGEVLELIEFTLKDLLSPPSFSVRELVIPWLSVEGVPDQFTGLLDKNEKEIYEGDRITQEMWNGGDGVIDPSERDEFEGVVVWDVNGWSLDTGKGPEVGLMANDKFVTTEIIGNIHEDKDANNPTP